MCLCTGASTLQLQKVWYIMPPPREGPWILPRAATAAQGGGKIHGHEREGGIMT
jgi:hypothetical protein